MRRSGVRIPLAPPQADIRSGCRFFVCLGALLPLVFRAPEGPAVGPGCFVCPWAAVFLLLLIITPTDLRPPRGLPARSPSAPRSSLGASSRSPARPRRPRGGLQSVEVSVCCLPRPRRLPQAPQPGYRTKRVGFVATFRLFGAGKSALKLVVSSWGMNTPKCPACGRV